MKIVKVGAIVLNLVPGNGKFPEHLLWKRALEREWAGPWGTIARLTGYRYKMFLDPAFGEERPQFKKGELHWYEWILCANGGIIRLYDDRSRLGTIWTTQATGEKLLAKVPGAQVHFKSDERLALVIRFPLEHILQVCELAGARKAKRLSETQKAQLRVRALEWGLGRPPASP
jgi:hypothetical protein